VARSGQKKLIDSTRRLCADTPVYLIEIGSEFFLIVLISIAIETDTSHLRNI
jgi:hypothetical protein